MIETRRLQQGLLLAAGVCALAIVAVGLSSSEDDTENWLPPVHVPLKPQAVSFKASMTVLRPACELERVWCNSSSLPLILRFLHTVEVLDAKHVRWNLRSTLGVSLSLKLSLVEHIADSLLHWEVEGAGVRGSVQVTFDEQGNAAEPRTELAVHIDLRAEGTEEVPLAPLETFFGVEPGQRLADDLRRLALGLERGMLKVS